MPAQGLLTVDASRAAFISTLTVVVVPILAGLSGKGVRTLTWASALGATLGCALLGTGNGAGFGVGDLLSVLSAVFFGIQARACFWQGSRSCYMRSALRALAHASQAWADG